KLRKQRDQVQQLSELQEPIEKRKPSPIKKRDAGIVVEGIDSLLVRLSKCCNPVPGDDIVGFITRGRGVSVHRADCPNVHTDDANERLIQVEWEGDKGSREYSVEIEISGYDRRGLLNEVLQAVNETKTNITAVAGKSDRNKMAIIHMTISIKNTGHLQKVVERIKQISEIYSVRRLMQ
ncbi:MAG: ACT domain-containing protein, partial [Bacillaceae bacterium]|nr:ACT domain-containing protein [Bacillaceae bacterium]